MIPSITRKSVIIKCTQKKSVLLGNYEFYYIAGLMKKLFGLPLTADMKPQEMMDLIQENKKNFTPKNDKEEYLIQLVSIYLVEDKTDEQMIELFEWGATEEDLWQMKTKRH